MQAHIPGALKDELPVNLLYELHSLLLSELGHAKLDCCHGY